MRLVYIDEAGISNPSHEPYVTVAGLIVHGDEQLRDIRQYLATLLIKHIPFEMQVGFVFHAAEIFNGGKRLPRDEWPLERRLEIARDIAEIPSRFGAPVALSSVRKEHIKQTFFKGEEVPSKALNRISLAMAFLICCHLVDKWMQENTTDEHCVMVVEDNPDSRGLLREVQDLHQERAAQAIFDEITSQNTSLKRLVLGRIQEEPLFQAKRSVNCMEVADFCAYVWKRILVNENDPLYRPYLDLFWSQVVHQ